MKDLHGRELNKGDKVTILCTVKEIGNSCVALTTANSPLTYLTVDPNVVEKAEDTNAKEQG